MAKSRLIWTNLQSRPEQVPPKFCDSGSGREETPWDSFIYMAGRGAGKTRAAVEWLVWEAIRKPDSRWAIIAPTMSDARHTCVEGESGLVAALDRYGVRYDFLRSANKITLESGSQLFLFSSEEPDRLRGPQFHGAWCDELGAFSRPEVYDLLLPTLRLGKHPQLVITTTPRQTSLMRELINIPNPGRVIRRGTTFDNKANLPESMIENLRSRFDGTKKGRQELYGELLDNFEDALFFRNHIEENRIVESPAQMPWYRVVVGVDPANTSNPDSALTGIVVVGVSADFHYYVLEDGSLRGQPNIWGQKAIDLAKKYNSTAIVLESNSGGEMVEAVIKNLDRRVKTRLVRASKGKDIRAEPISALYAINRVHHVGRHPELEDQMCNWIPNERGPSPDRMDALVWAITDLSENFSNAMLYLHNFSYPCPTCYLPVSRKTLFCDKCNSAITPPPSDS